MADIFSTLIGLAPNMGFAALAIYVLWKISTNALHGQAETNLELTKTIANNNTQLVNGIADIAKTNTQIVDTMGIISKTLSDHSNSDALIFTEIRDNLARDGAILEQRTGMFGQIITNQGRITDSQSRMCEVLARLEERTKRDHTENVILGLAEKLKESDKHV